MSISAMADAIVRKLVPTATAGACLASIPCGACTAYTNVCRGGLIVRVSYYTKKTDCLGRCTINQRSVCSERYTAQPC